LASATPFQGNMAVRPVLPSGAHDQGQLIRNYAQPGPPRLKSVLEPSIRELGFQEIHRASPRGIMPRVKENWLALSWGVCAGQFHLSRFLLERHG